MAPGLGKEAAEPRVKEQRRFGESSSHENSPFQPPVSDGSWNNLPLTTSPSSLIQIQPGLRFIAGLFVLALAAFSQGEIE